MLLHFYRSTQARSEAYRKSLNTLILSVIKDMPDAPRCLAVPIKLFPQSDGDAFDQAKALWLSQIEKYSDNVRVIRNASFFFRMVDDVMASKLLRRCKDLEPGNPEWSRELGTLYSFRGGRRQSGSRQDWGLMGLAELEAAWQSESDPNCRFVLLLQLPRVALRAAQIEKAQLRRKVACDLGGSR